MDREIARAMDMLLTDIESRSRDLIDACRRGDVNRCCDNARIIESTARILRTALVRETQ